MKVRRYAFGQTNIDMAESAARSIISPQQLASMTAAPYDAFAKAGQSIANDLLRLNEQDRKLKAQEDYRQQQLMDVGVQAAYAEHIKNPAWDKQTQPDGTPTDTAMREAWEETLKELEQGLTKFNDPATAKFYSQKWELTKQKIGAYHLEEINKRRQEWDADSLNTLFNVSLEGKDFAFADQMADEMLDKGYIQPAGHRALKNTVRSEKIDFESDLVLDAYRRTADKDEFFKDLIANPDEDEDLQRASVAKVNAERINEDRAEAESRALAVGQMRLRLGDIIDRIDNPTGDPNFDPLVEAEKLYNDMIGLDPMLADTAGVWVNQIRAAMRSQTGKADDWTEYLMQRNSALGLVDNSEKMRKAAQHELALQLNAVKEELGEVPPQMAFDLEVALAKSTGILTDERFRALKRSISDPRTLAEAASFWQAINDNPTMTVRTDGLTKEVEIMLASTVSRATSGMSMGESAALTIQRVNMDNRDHKLTQDRENRYYAEVKADNVEERLDDLLDEKYDNWMILGAEQPNAEDDYLRYRVYLQDAYVLTGNWDDAYAAADAYFRSSHAMTNINGEWEVMYNGLEGDWERLRLNFYDEVKDGKYGITRADGTIAASTLEDVEEFTFANPRIVNGIKVFDVLYGGSPIIEDTAAGRQIVTYAVEAADLRKAETAAAKEESIKKIEQYGKDYTNAMKWLNSTNPYVDREDVANTIRSTPALIEAEAQNIDIARRKAEERYPDM